MNQETPASNVFDLLIPVPALASISIPSLSVADGSGNPEWVTIPCSGKWRYGKTPSVRLPLDSMTAQIARRWLEVRRIDRIIIAPAFGVLMLAGLALIVFGNSLGYLAYVAGLSMIALAVLINSMRGRAERHLLRPCYPRLEGNAVRIGGVPDEVRIEWVSRNPEVDIQVVRGE